MEQSLSAPSPSNSSNRKVKRWVMTRFTFLFGPSGSASWPSRPAQSPSFSCRRSPNRSKPRDSGEGPLAAAFHASGSRAHDLRVRARQIPPERGGDSAGAGRAEAPAAVGGRPSGKIWRDVVCSSLVVVLVVTAALLVAVIYDGVALAAGAWVAPASEKMRADPLPGDAKTLQLGEKVATVNCVPCHGSHFKGDGPVATTLNPRPADWTSTRVQDQTDGELFWKISAGRGAMPSWKHLSEKERWAVVRFIKSLRAS
jgi:mono/diheme cytochrome c family protein